MADESVEYPELVDVLRYETTAGASYRSVPAGEGKRIVAVHEDEVRKQLWVRRIVLGVVAATVVAFGVLTGNALLGTIGAGIVLVAAWQTDADHSAAIPDLVDERIRHERASSTYDIDTHTTDPWNDEE
ncbi:hypothetical protein [Natrinema longum]|uniref:Uncharacterized protein n=1 Tax=Natrinema longum TaxID=370324 RepID=A0A8A2U987_9EURY|nr:hypothetical protein [Natrinema longum]MBZ6493730.1 hypothetical protein [Natrinema longum]QSW84932.1 hypothetical protein J0X27_15995 [Natrinema longum]